VFDTEVVKTHGVCICACCILVLCVDQAVWVVVSISMWLSH